MQQSIQSRIDTVWACCLLHNYVAKHGCTDVGTDCRNMQGVVDSWIDRSTSRAASPASDSTFETAGRPNFRQREAKLLRVRWYNIIQGKSNQTFVHNAHYSLCGTCTDSYSWSISYHGVIRASVMCFERNETIQKTIINICLRQGEVVIILNFCWNWYYAYTYAFRHSRKRACSAAAVYKQFCLEERKIRWQTTSFSYTTTWAIAIKPSRV